MAQTQKSEFTPFFRIQPVETNGILFEEGDSMLFEDGEIMLYED